MSLQFFQKLIGPVESVKDPLSLSVSMGLPNSELCRQNRLIASLKGFKYSLFHFI